MIKHKLPLGILLLVSLWPLFALAEDAELPLGVGLSKTLKISGMSRISIANPRIADVRVVKTEVIVTGVGVGRTSLLVWKRNGEKLTYLVVVSSDETLQAYEEIKRALKDVEGVNVRLAVNHIVLEGSIYSTDDRLLVDKLMDLYPKQLRSFVVIQ